MNHTQSKILECTLRDGSYVNGFRFSKDDTATLLRALEQVGFSMIELGHGMGLGASELGGKLAALETDETYLQTACETVQSAMWGMFCIPGIATLDHVDMAAEHRMKFIRIGVNIEEHEKLKPFIERAKQHGFYVCANLMKSYTVSPARFAEYAVEIEKYGIDLLYIVDSAGGMLPDELRQYIQATKDACPTMHLGFHGHNNLGLGVANSLMAYEHGVEVIDTTLQGFGRSSGNAPTEQLLGVLLRRGVDMDIDPIAVMDIGEQYIQPLIERKGLSSLDTISGLALFHSSYMPVIQQYASQYQVDPRKLIVAVCQQSLSEAPDALVEDQAKKLADAGEGNDWKASYKNYIGGEQ